MLVSRCVLRLFTISGPVDSAACMRLGSVHWGLSQKNKVFHLCFSKTGANPVSRGSQQHENFPALGSFFFIPFDIGCTTPKAASSPSTSWADFCNLCFSLTYYTLPVSFVLCFALHGVWGKAGMPSFTPMNY